MSDLCCGMEPIIGVWYCGAVVRWLNKRKTSFHSKPRPETTRKPRYKKKTSSKQHTEKVKSIAKNANDRWKKLYDDTKSDKLWLRWKMGISKLWE